MSRPLSRCDSLSGTRKEKERWDALTLLRDDGVSCLCVRDQERWLQLINISKWLPFFRCGRHTEDAHPLHFGWRAPMPFFHSLYYRRLFLRRPLLLPLLSITHGGDIGGGGVSSDVDVCVWFPSSPPTTIRLCGFGERKEREWPLMSSKKTDRALVPTVQSFKILVRAWHITATWSIFSPA